MNALLRRLAALDQRLAGLIVCAVCLLAVFEVWVVLRAPLAELRALTATRDRLRSSALRDAGSAAEVDRLKRELDAAGQLLAGPRERGDDAMVPFLITTLDAVAVRHGVSLGGVKPPLRRPIAPFEEIAFQVDARGDYRAVFDWLRDAAAQVDPLVVVDFSVKAIDEGQRVALSVRFADYRLPGIATPPSELAR